MVEFCVTKSAGQEVVSSLAGGILYFERSSALTFFFSSGTDMGVFPPLWGFGRDLVTNKFTKADEVEGHGVIALTRLDSVGGVMVAVVTVFVGTESLMVWVVQGVFQLTSHFIASYWTGDPCFLSLILL